MALLSSGLARGDREREAFGVLDKGIALFSAGYLGEARDAFARAHELAPDQPQPSRWLGLTDARLGRCREAVGELDAFIKRSPPAAPATQKAIVTRDECQATVTKAATAAPAPAAAPPPPGPAPGPSPAMPLARPPPPASSAGLPVASPMRTVAGFVLDAQRVSGAPPQIPDYVMRASKGHKLMGIYKLCVNPQGRVFTVTSIAPIPGADASIIETLYDWRYKPQPSSVCAQKSLTFRVP